jgi:hypothetical protein
MPDIETTALIERLQQSIRRWKWLALSLLVGFSLALVLLTTSAALLWVRAERQARQAEAAAQEARQQEQDARKLLELEAARQHQGQLP